MQSTKSNYNFQEYENFGDSHQKLSKMISKANKISTSRNGLLDGYSSTQSLPRSGSVALKSEKKMLNCSSSLDLIGVIGPDLSKVKVD